MLATWRDAPKRSPIETLFLPLWYTLVALLVIYGTIEWRVRGPLND